MMARVVSGPCNTPMSSLKETHEEKRLAGSFVILLENLLANLLARAAH